MVCAQRPHVEYVSFDRGHWLDAHGATRLRHVMAARDIGISFGDD